MINPNLLSDSLAAQVASEVIYSKLEKATIDHLTNEIMENVSKELLDVSIVYIEEMKRNLLFETLYKALVPYEKKFVTMLKGIWEEERKIIVANIKKMRKAYLRKDAIDQLLYPRAVAEKKLSAQATEIILVILTERGPIEMGTIAGAEAVFNVQNLEVQKWLASYTPKFSMNLEEVNVAKLRAELIEGINAGEGIPELIKRVNLTYEHWNKVRSETIARSETIRASNRAAIEAYKQSGVVKKKVWITSPGACPWCVPLDGKVVALEKHFFSQGDAYSVTIGGKRRTMRLDYENVEAPPLHPRCRCAIGPWIKET